MSERLEQQIGFLLEIDGLKSVLRRSYLLGADRRENVAEHSWHAVLAAMLLTEHANEAVDRLRVLEMLAVHDLVELDAGDTYIYDEAGKQGQADREQQAAERIFGLLPLEQGGRMRGLWEEFEALQTPEARFAKALDRLLPLLHNFHTGGRSWREHGVVDSQVRELHEGMRAGSERLAAFARETIDAAVQAGYLARDDAGEPGKPGKPGKR